LTLTLNELVALKLGVPLSVTRVTTQLVVLAWLNNGRQMKTPLEEFKVAFVGAFRKHRDSIKLVTFWGVTDADSWRRNGRPLLFDGNWQPKPAFDAVIQAASE
jgi:GH35 family endo-1,4-beta-xylanase